MENHTPQNNGESDVNKFVGAPRMSSMWSYPPRPYDNYPHYRNHYPESSPQQQQVSMQPQYQQPSQQQFSQQQQFQQQVSSQQIQQMQQHQQPAQQVQHVQLQQPQQILLQKLPTPVQQQQPSMPQIQVASVQQPTTTPQTVQPTSIVQPITQQTPPPPTTTSEPPVATSASISSTQSSSSSSSSSAQIVGTTLQSALTSSLSQHSQASAKSSSVTSQLVNSQHQLQQPMEQPTKILTRNRLQDLVREVDPNEQLDEDVEDILLQIADDFVENAITNACLLAKHRKSNTVEVKDLQLHLERNWNMWIPGFGTDELRPYKKSSTTEAHKQRQTLIKKHMKKT